MSKDDRVAKPSSTKSDRAAVGAPSRASSTEGDALLALASFGICRGGS